MAMDARTSPALGTKQLDAAEIARLCGIAVENPESFSHIEGVTTLPRPKDHLLIFLDRFGDDKCRAIEAATGASILFVLPPDYRGRIGRPALFTPHPREAFSRLVVAMFDYDSGYWNGFEDSATTQARLPNTRIFPGSQIHRDAQIGEGSVVFPGNVIGPKVTIGKRAAIRPCSAIGFSGYGIFRGADNRNAHLPHVGGVLIGDDVEIGSFTTVCAGTIHPTVIEDTAKIDDHVHIAHNCQIGEGARVIAHAEVSGSVIVERNAWLAPNVSILEGTRIGENAFVGIAANVTKDVPPNMLVVGNPAKVLRELPQD